MKIAYAAFIALLTIGLIVFMIIHIGKAAVIGYINCYSAAVSSTVMLAESAITAKTSCWRRESIIASFP